MTWAAWIIAAVGPIVARVLFSLGAGIVTYAGTDAAMQAAISHVRTAFSGLSPDLVQIFAMAGIFKAISISLGGMVSGMIFMQVRKFTFSALKK